MRTCWTIFCLDRQEANMLYEMSETIHSSKLRYIQNQLSVGKFPVLALPVKLNNNYDTKAVSLIEQLPYDILFGIFSQIQPTSGILILALTCYRMLVSAQQFIRANSNKLMTPWVNTRIICCGEDDYGPLPKYMLTQKEISEQGVEWFYSRLDLSEWETTHPFNDISIIDREQLWNHQQTIKILLGDRKIVYPNESEAALRNKTLKVYICGSKIPDMPQKVCLGVILILQICWCSSDSIALQYQLEGQENGPWAGHRFDITWSSEVDESWTDVSEEVIEKLQPLLDAEFGEEE